jgi:hypothetical protein
MLRLSADDGTWLRERPGACPGGELPMNPPGGLW